MKSSVKVLLLAVVLVLSVIEYAQAADNASHTVTVIVSSINELAITGGNVTLTCDTATAGQEPEDAVDSTTADLDWTTNEASKKITVATNLGSPTFTLKVVAQNVTGGGIAAPEVTLITTPRDFVTGVGMTTGGCDLQYTASATAAQGTGSDAHTVTYTLTDDL